MAKKRRRPRHLRGPKIYGYTVPGGIRTHAGDALPGAGLYTVAWRDAHRKRRPNAKEGIRSSYYFAFTKGGGWHEPPGDLERSGMTRTHWMLQELIREYRFVQCEVNGEYISYEYDQVELEKRSAPVFEIGKGARQADISGVVAKSNIADLRGTEVVTEIGVTSLVVAYERYFDLVKSKITTLEIIVERNKTLEENPTELLSHLKKLLLDGGLKGRWIVAPWRKEAKIKPVDTVLDELDEEAKREKGKLVQITAEMEQFEHAAREIPEPESLSAIDRRKLRDLDHETRAAMALANEKHNRDIDDVDLLAWVFELVFPPMRSARHQSLRQQLRDAQDQIRAKDAFTRAGLLSHFKKMEAAVNKRNDEKETQRRELLLKINVLKGTIPAIQERIRACESSRSKLLDLRRIGMLQILIPSGISLENAIEFEHRRWYK